jgi:hypothetical protein
LTTATAATAAAVPGTAGRRAGTALQNWWFTPMPLGRVAALRVVLYLFVWVDVFFYAPPVLDRVQVPSAYRPLGIERVLHLPTPTHTYALVIEVALLCLATVTATGRAPRLLGTITFALYLDWLLIGDSYGYVPHDRFAFIVALAVLPTAGPARLGDRACSQRAGWALRCVQVAVVATYALAPWAKFRYGGAHWANGAVLTWALLRRGTALGRPLLHVPWLLLVLQWCTLIAELTSPVVLFLRGRMLYLAVAAMLTFHLFSEATMTISFLPHVLCLLAFLPLERLGPARPSTDCSPAVSVSSAGVQRS